MASAASANPQPGPATQRFGRQPAPYDLAGIGVGPFNLSLAALGQGVPRLRLACFERNPAFHWHPGLLIEGSTLQVPFLADLVTMADPSSPWSFLRYLRAHDRLFPFYVAERFHIDRAEYDAYCRWVSEGLGAAPGGDGTGLHFGHRVDAVRWDPEFGVFEVDYTRTGEPEDSPTATGRAHARHLALGIGTAPHVPGPLRPLAEAPETPVIHSADYLRHRETLLAADHVTVIGSGQSGAEILLDLLRRRPRGQEGLHWLTRSAAFAPMEYSKLGLEHFTPDYTRYFHGLSEPARDVLLPRQWQLHKAVDHETLAAIHDELYRRTLGGGWPDAVLVPGVRVRTAGRIGPGRVELHLEHVEQNERTTLTTDAVVLATGYRERSFEELLPTLAPAILRDASGRPRIDGRYRLVTDSRVRGSIFVQNAERHTHGVGAPDLGLAAHRSATILNTLSGRAVYPLPTRTAFTTFGLRGATGHTPPPAGPPAVQPARTPAAPPRTEAGAQS
ncbi:lysine 6-monooxygenase [Streptomyces sp. AJS327]|uniref:lysine N(6)-hydroxylase/L-ornithine N(5)-oxygenase family protein n=1 Tax=Streptomyces sp. AJS327 TaxID=2545265 RepID=UPI0015DFA7AA|nr:lysine 6-monooxygenase [Streptomyces sp. AJS327]